MVDELISRLTGPILESIEYLKPAYSASYGTYYHWNFGKKLMIKAGGMFDVYGAMKNSSPDGVNNNMNFDAQLMFKGHAAIKYGWDFKKWALDIRGSLTLPAFGMMFVSHPSETVLAIGGNDHSVVKKNSDIPSLHRTTASVLSFLTTRKSRQS